MQKQEKPGIHDVCKTCGHVYLEHCKEEKGMAGGKERQYCACDHAGCKCELFVAKD